MQKTAERYHAFDSLRASMMLLGIVLHAAVSYTAVKLPAWGFRDPHNHHLSFDLLVLFIHQFRMPLFFVMAGFFAALLVEKRGVAYTLNNRLKRIGIPFVLFWILTTFPSHYGFQYANFGEVRWADFSVSDYAPQMAHKGTSTMHLWFLYYLLMFYALLGVWHWLKKQLPDKWSKTALALTYVLLVSRLRLLFLLPLSALFFVLMQSGTFDTAVSIVPDIKVLGAYGLFFVFGYSLFCHRSVLGHFNRFWLLHLFVGVLLVLPFALLLEQFHLSRHWADKCWAAAIGSWMTWALVLGFMGFFMRYAARFSPLWAYISQASYWVYLVHLPVVIWVAALLGGYELNAGFKFLAGIAVAASFCLSSYHFLVRRTWLGLLLNGKKHP